ncbi:MAG: hypothetical protein ACJAUH_000583, partial [Saprospiraceae bacterium]
MNRIIFVLAMLISTSVFAQIPPQETIRNIEPAKEEVRENEDVSKEYAQTITSTDLRQILTIIASDEMEGRETASVGQ